METFFKIFDAQVLSLAGVLFLLIAGEIRYNAKVARRRKWYHEKKLTGKI